VETKTKSIPLTDKHMTVYCPALEQTNT